MRLARVECLECKTEAHERWTGKWNIENDSWPFLQWTSFLKLISRLNYQKNKEHEKSWFAETHMCPFWGNSLWTNIKWKLDYQTSSYIETTLRKIYLSPSLDRLLWRTFEIFKFFLFREPYYASFAQFRYVVLDCTLLFSQAWEFHDIVLDSSIWETVLS